MGFNTASEIVVAGTGQVYVAPEGTALPTTTGASAGAGLDAAFYGLGYHTEEGATFRSTVEQQTFSAWQSRQPVRRELSSQEIQISFELIQWNEVTLPLAMGGGSVTGSTPNYKYSFPDDNDVLDVRALVLEVEDGSERHRFCFARANAVETVEATFNRTSMAGLPLTFSVLAPTAGGSPGDYYTNSAGFLLGSA